MDLEVGDYFVVTRGERLHPSIMGALASLDLPPVYSPIWWGSVLEALEVQDRLIVARVIGRSPLAVATDALAVGSHQILDLSRVKIQTVSRRFAELMRPVPISPPPVLGLNLAAVPVPAPPERTYVQIGQGQQEAR